MKPTIALLILTLSAGAYGQTNALGETDDGTPLPPQASKPTFIADSLEVAPFSPPAPILRKALPAVRIDSSIAVTAKSSRTLTLQRGAASTLPDLPPPPIPEISELARTATPQELADAAASRRRSLHLGATIY